MSQGDIQPLRVEGAGTAHDAHRHGLRSTGSPAAPFCHGVWEGLLGVDVVQKAGSYPVVVTATRPDGTTASAQTTVVGHRPPLHHAEALSRREIRRAQHRPTPARIAAEADRLAAICKAVPNRHWHGPFSAPVTGPATSNFGSRSVFNGQPRAPHAGIDYRGAVGTPIVAPNAGRVVLAEDLFLTGNTVVVDHGLGPLLALRPHVPNGRESRRRRDHRRAASAWSAPPAASPARICTGACVSAPPAWTRRRCCAWGFRLPASGFRLSTLQ